MRRRWPTFLLACFTAVVLAAGFGISPTDANKVRTFTQAVPQWQRHADFRRIAVAYSILSNEAMQVQWMGMSATRIMMALRSIPGLPPSVAVAPTSQRHYDNFTRGPLSAYLHLSGEQGTADIIGPIEGFATRVNPTDADIASFVHQTIQLDPPVNIDAGGAESFRNLLAETQAQRPFAIRAKTDTLMQPAIARIATRLGIPADPHHQTPTQQRAVLIRLDAEVKAMDPELWRTKQLNDFSSGIWAQCFGRTYNWILVPLLWIRRTAQVIGALLVVAMLMARPARWRGNIAA